MQFEINLEKMYGVFLNELLSAVSDRNHGFHILQFGTSTADGPQIRSVVLRRVELNPLRLFFHTHIDSPKVNEIKTNSRTAIHAYCSSCKMQLRFSGSASLLTDGDVFKEQLQKMTASSSRCYLAPYPPSSSLESYHPNMPDQYINKAPTNEEKLPHYPKFVVVEFIPTEIDALWLRAVGHVRIGGVYSHSDVHLDWRAP
jgi:pyridoxamine 5'-phosphate oxidase